MSLTMFLAMDLHIIIPNVIFCVASGLEGILSISYYTILIATIVNSLALNN